MASRTGLILVPTASTNLATHALAATGGTDTHPFRSHCVQQSVVKETTVMTISLNQQQAKALRMALHEAAGIARTYRERVADEDSILLVHDVEAISGLLGVKDEPVLQR
jgi:hypothetical protein